MKPVSLFWIIFMLFWAIPFPMLMYYNGFENMSSSAPVWALVWLGVSLLFWILLLIRFFRKLVLRRYTSKSNLSNLMQSGDLKTATITQSVLAAPEYPGINKYDLTLEFKNFVGTTIHDTLSINDSHPELNKYQKGKTLQIRIDKSLQNTPYIQVDGAHYNAPKANNIIMAAFWWLVMVAIVAWYYYFAYEHQSNGMGWRFLVWYHPLLICPVILRFVSIFFTGTKYSSNQLKHKYYGYRTTADLLSAAQTGTYINEQPQVRFNLQYTDHNNRQQTASFTKVISLLDVGMTKEKHIDIFYLQDAPGDISLASDIEPN